MNKKDCLKEGRGGGLEGCFAWGLSSSTSFGSLPAVAVGGDVTAAVATRLWMVVLPSKSLMSSSSFPPPDGLDVTSGRPSLFAAAAAAAATSAAKV